MPDDAASLDVMAEVYRRAAMDAAARGEPTESGLHRAGLLAVAALVRAEAQAAAAAELERVVEDWTRVVERRDEAQAAAAAEAVALRGALTEICDSACDGTQSSVVDGDLLEAARAALSTPQSEHAARVVELIEAADEVEGLRPIIRLGDADGIRTMGIGLDRLRDAAAALKDGGGGDA